MSALKRTLFTLVDLVGGCYGKTQVKGHADMSLKMEIHFQKQNNWSTIDKWIEKKENNNYRFRRLKVFGIIFGFSDNEWLNDKGMNFPFFLAFSSMTNIPFDGDLFCAEIAIRWPKMMSCIWMRMRAQNPKNSIGRIVTLML